MDIVIPYTPDKNSGIELRMALRSIEKYLTGYGRIIIVGKPPSWLKTFHVVINGQGKEIHQGVAVFPVHDEPTRKEYSIMKKIKFACMNDHVSENFIMWHDDHFLLKPLNVVDMKYWYNHTLEVAASHAKGGYLQTIRNTMKVLSMTPMVNYDIHVPMVMNKEWFLNAVVPIFADGKEYCIKSLYGRFYTGEVMSDCKLNGPYSYKAIMAKIKDRLFFSTGQHGLTPAMTAVFEELYPSPSQWEK